MGKPNGHPLKDITINQPNGSKSAKPANEDDMCNFDLNIAGNNPMAHDMKDIAKKGKLIKIEPVTVTAFKSTRRIKLEPGFKKPTSSHEPASRLSLGSSKKMTARGKSPRLRFRQDPAAARGSAPEPSGVHGSALIVMSCLNCYMHVMACDDNPKCPNCGNGGGLLDIHRA